MRATILGRTRHALARHHVPKAGRVQQFRLCTVKVVAEGDEASLTPKKAIDGSGFGSVSPWAVFAEVPEQEDVPEAERALLSAESVAIPMSDQEEEGQPGHLSLIHI